MHPLYRPIVLIIWLCAVSIGLNGLALWWLHEARIPTAPVASSQAVGMPIPHVKPPAEMAPCKPTVAGNEAPLAEREADIAQLQAEVDRLNSTKGNDGAAWRTKAEQLEQEFTMLHKVAERVLEMDARHWQEGKLMLAHALMKEKT